MSSPSETQRAQNVSVPSRPPPYTPADVDQRLPAMPGRRCAGGLRPQTSGDGDQEDSPVPRRVTVSTRRPDTEICDQLFSAVQAAAIPSVGPIFVRFATTAPVHGVAQYQFDVADTVPPRPRCPERGQLPQLSGSDLNTHSALMRSLATGGVVIPAWHPDAPGSATHVDPTSTVKPGCPDTSQSLELKGFYQHPKGGGTTRIAFLLALPFDPLCCRSFMDQISDIERVAGALPTAKVLQEWLQRLRDQASEIMAESTAHALNLQRAFEASQIPRTPQGRLPPKHKRTKKASRSTAVVNASSRVGSQGASQGPAVVSTGHPTIDDDKLLNDSGFLKSSITAAFPAAFVGEYVREGDADTKKTPVMPPWWGPPRASYYRFPFRRSAPHQPAGRGSAHDENLFIAREWVFYARRCRLGLRKLRASALSTAPYTDSDYDPDTWLELQDGTQWLTDHEDDDNKDVPCGVTERAVPPWVARQLAGFAAPIVNFAAHIVRQVANEHHLGPYTMSPDQRLTNGGINYKGTISQDVAHQLFGNAGAVRDPLQPTPGLDFASSFPPTERFRRPDDATSSSSPPPNLLDTCHLYPTPASRHHQQSYHEQVKRGISHLLDVVTRNDQHILSKICDLDGTVDDHYLAFFAQLSQDGAPVPTLPLQWMVKEHSRLLELSRSYGPAPPSALLVKVVSVFRQSAKLLSCDAPGLMPVAVAQMDAMHRTLRALDTFDASECPRGARAPHPTAAPNAKVPSAVKDDALDQVADTLFGPDSEYGVADYREMDMWDLACHLGLEGFQDQRRVALAESVEMLKAADPSYNVHAFERDEDGQPKLDDLGEPVWVHPEGHKARSEIDWPFFNKYDIQSPRDPVAWQQLVESASDANGAVPVPDDSTHFGLSPQWHQVVAVANVLDRGYVWNSWSPQHWTTILSDETGLGKTWIPLMVITLLRYHHIALLNDPQYAPPVMNWDKRRYRFDPTEDPDPCVSLLRAKADMKQHHG